MSGAIDIDEYTNRGAQGAVELATAFIGAAADAVHGTVTYVYSDGEIIAAVSPPEAGERFEHAGEVLVQARREDLGHAPVPVRSKPRPPWYVRGVLGLLGLS